MSSAARRIEIAAAAFWARAGGRQKYGQPVDLEHAITSTLPLGVCRLSTLSTAKIAAILERIGAVPWPSAGDRPLRGCLIADIGAGLIFIDGEDPADEQLYSLAHECAHFLLHYLKPRMHAVETLGSNILEVLDRHRAPTAAERFSAALAAVPLEPFRHAVTRSADGQPTHFRTRGMEAEADGLAVELIVPLSELRSLPSVAPSDLAAYHGLPLYVAEAVTRELESYRDSEGVIGMFRKVPNKDRTSGASAEGLLERPSKDAR
jgi:IrrE N-terminal-like domain